MIIAWLGLTREGGTEEAEIVIFEIESGFSFRSIPHTGRTYLLMIRIYSNRKRCHTADRKTRKAFSAEIRVRLIRHYFWPWMRPMKILVPRSGSVCLTSLNVYVIRFASSASSLLRNEDFNARHSQRILSCVWVSEEKNSSCLALFPLRNIVERLKLLILMIYIDPNNLLSLKWTNKQENYCGDRSRGPWVCAVKNDPSFR